MPILVAVPVAVLEAPAPVLVAVRKPVVSRTHRLNKHSEHVCLPSGKTGVMGRVDVSLEVLETCLEMGDVGAKFAHFDLQVGVAC